MAKTAEKFRSSESATDTIMSWLVGVIVVAATAASFYFSKIALYWRLLAWMALLPVLWFLLLQTKQGQRLKIFFEEARVEFFKVVWPSRQEAIQSTIAVLVMVLVMGFIIWLADNLFMQLIEWLTVSGRGR